MASPPQRVPGVYIANLNSSKIKGLPDIFETLGKKYFLPVPQVSKLPNKLEQQYYDIVARLYKPGESRYLERALVSFTLEYSTELQVHQYANSRGVGISEEAKSDFLNGVIRSLRVQESKLAHAISSQRFYDDLPGTDQKSPIDLTKTYSNPETSNLDIMPKRTRSTSHNKSGKENANPLRVAKKTKVETTIDPKQRTLSFEKHPPILPKNSLKNKAEDFPCLSQNGSNSDASAPPSFPTNDSLNTSMNTDTSEETIPDVEPPEIPFHVLYETYRVTSNAHPTLCKDLANCGAQAAWERFRVAPRTSNGTKIPERIQANAWNKLKDAAQKGKWVNEIQLSGKLKFSDKTLGYVPTVHLEPLRVEKSNQYWRTWGSHRFMTVRLPSLDRDALSKVDQHLTPEKATNLLKKFRDDGFELLDRAWKVYYYREHGNKDNGKPDGKWQNFSLIMFAVSGVGISDCSISDLLEWHISLKVPKNREKSEAEFWSRIALGFSKSTQTVRLQREEVVLVKDLRSKIDARMDDGCQLCSPAVLREVADILGLTVMPTAVQARIGGAKGIWMLDPSINLESEERWVKINESQLKFAFHTKYDPDWYTLNVLKCSHTPKAATLNTQFIPILVHGGVPLEALAKLMKEDIDHEIGELCRRLDDAPYVRSWIERTKLPVRSEIVFQGSLPQGFAEIALMFLENGFTMHNCEFLKNILNDIIRSHCDDLKAKMHIHVPRSAHAFCVPDPTGELKEGEVFFKFSESRLDEKMKQTYDQIIGDLVVGRNPAHLVSDIQRVTAVDCFALRNIKDVIVFSVQGDRSLASKLAGGDYDGDSPWICWDPRIVSNFENKSVPSVTGVDEYFEKTSTVFMNDHVFCDPFRPTDKGLDWITPFIEKYLDISLRDNLIGRCTNFHVYYSYHKGIEDSQAELLAAINGRLHDCAKAGERIIDNQWAKLDKKYRGCATPHYIQDTPPSVNKVPRLYHPIDILKFNVLKTYVDIKMGEFSEKFGETPASDRDLTKMYWEYDKCLKVPLTATEAMDEESRARDKINREQVTEVLKALNADLTRLNLFWTEELGRRDAASAMENFARPANSIKPVMGNIHAMNMIKQRTYDQYEMISPLNIPGNFFVQDLIRTAKQPFSQWSLLKASTAFYKFGSIKFVWQLCARELCYMKLRAVDPECRTMSSGMYLSLKSRKQVSQGADEEEEEVMEKDVTVNE